MIERGKSIYQISPEKHGLGTFYYTKCCNNRMYSVKDIMAYHGKLCPKCFHNNKNITLYLAGTPEAIELLKNNECIFAKGEEDDYV